MEENIEPTHSLLDFTVVVGVEHAVGAVRPVARHEHAAEAVVLEAVASARRLVAPDGAPLALGVAVELDTFAVRDAAAVLAVLGEGGGEEGGEHEGHDGELHGDDGSGGWGGDGVKAVGCAVEGDVG